MTSINSDSEKKPLLASPASSIVSSTVNPTYNATDGAETASIPQYIIDRKTQYDAMQHSSADNIHDSEHFDPLFDYEQNDQSSLMSWGDTYRGKSRIRRIAYNIVSCCGMMQAIGENIKSILYGGMDGITTVFVSVATIYSGNVTLSAVLIIGIAKLLSGSLSMGVGDFMSSKAELDLIRQERKRELWECENFLQGEMNEMVDIYSDKGIRRDVADKMVDLMSKNKEAFVDVMMVQELGLKANYDPWAPLKNGITNFMSFIFFGIIPLLIYIGFLIAKIVDKSLELEDDFHKNLIFFIDCGITVLALMGMGILKARFSTESWVMAVVTTLLVGFVAGGSGYLVALGLDKLVGFSD